MRAPQRQPEAALCLEAAAHNNGPSDARGNAMYRNILVATDGSRLSMKAVDHAIGLARALGARLTAFYASPDYPMPAYAEGVVYDPMSPQEYELLCKKEADKIFKKVALKAAASRVKLTTVHSISSTPWEAILAAAKKQKADAIAMASHARTGVSALLLGSQTQKVLTHSRLPVIVVR
jgi:nucleotide-binding universal stress UspA family protein